MYSCTHDLFDFLYCAFKILLTFCHYYNAICKQNYVYCFMYICYFHFHMLVTFTADKYKYTRNEVLRVYVQHEHTTVKSCNFSRRENHYIIHCEHSMYKYRWSQNRCNVSNPGLYSFNTSLYF